jgi:hypothetical protein
MRLHLPGALERRAADAHLVRHDHDLVQLRVVASAPHARHEHRLAAFGLQTLIGLDGCGPTLAAVDDVDVVPVAVDDQILDDARRMIERTMASSTGSSMRSS